MWYLEIFTVQTLIDCFWCIHRYLRMYHSTSETFQILDCFCMIHSEALDSDVVLRNFYIKFQTLNTLLLVHSQVTLNVTFYFTEKFLDFRPSQIVSGAVYQVPETPGKFLPSATLCLPLNQLNETLKLFIIERNHSKHALLSSGAYSQRDNFENLPF